MHQDAEGDCHQRELRQRRHRRDRHQVRIAAPCAENRQHGEDNGGGQRKNERIKAEFDDHWIFSLPLSWTPCAFSRSATSLGI